MSPFFPIPPLASPGLGSIPGLGSAPGARARAREGARFRNRWGCLPQGSGGPAGLSRVVGGMTGLDKHAASLGQTDRSWMATCCVSPRVGQCLPVSGRNGMGGGCWLGCDFPRGRGLLTAGRTRRQDKPTVPQNISQSGRQAAVPKSLLEPHAPLPPDGRALTFTTGPGRSRARTRPLRVLAACPPPCPPPCPRVLGSR